MKLYPVFLLLASITIVTPGPGVLMTVTNAIERGFREAFHGILGLALGSVAIASVSATSLGVMLTTSPAAFATMKYLGAAYLALLGVRNWSAQAPVFETEPVQPGGRRFAAGVTLQATNPQAIVFFLAVFPQFVDASREQIPQLTLLVASFGLLLVTIHSCYALLANRARAWLSADRSRLLVRRAGSVLFILFAVVLALKH